MSRLMPCSEVAPSRQMRRLRLRIGTAHWHRTLVLLPQGRFVGQVGFKEDPQAGRAGQDCPESSSLSGQAIRIELPRRHATPARTTQRNGHVGARGGPARGGYFRERCRGTGACNARPYCARILGARRTPARRTVHAARRILLRTQTALCMSARRCERAAEACSMLQLR